MEIEAVKAIQDDGVVADKDGASYSPVDRRCTVGDGLPSGSNVRSEVIQALRAAAALIVVAYHADTSFFGSKQYWAEQPFCHFFAFGHAGVDFFFVLSGFIIYSAHCRDIGVPGRVKGFVWKRFRRIYPVYWLVLSVSVVLFFAFPEAGHGFERGPSVIVASILLVHVFGQNGEVILVSWTLFHELLFYGIFAVLIADGRCGLIVFSVWMFGSITLLLQGPSVFQAVNFYFSPLHLLFIMGMLSAWLVDTRKIPAAGVVLFAGVSAFVGIGVAQVYGGNLITEVSHVFYGATSVTILVSAISLERQSRLHVPQSVSFLGNASYSIYLCHVLALSILSRIFIHITAVFSIPIDFVYVSMVSLSVAVSIIFYLMVEAPMLAVLHSHRRAVTTPLSVAVTKSL